MKRQSRGHGTIELACVAVMFAIVSVLSADIVFVLTACNVNDRACRDAARAAAQGSDQDNSMRLARAAARTHQIAASNIVTQPTIDENVFVYEDFNGQPPSHTSPYVSVTTVTRVKPFAPVWYGNASFNKRPEWFETRKTYEFPIVKTKLYLN